MKTATYRLVLLVTLMLVTIFACDKWDFDRAAFIQIITVGVLVDEKSVSIT